ncbi:MAG: hypothetical protein GWN16_10235 [Calditrichae bacterium]|nr:hypothetical protein [Calditrichia bacterium]
MKPIHKMLLIVDGIVNLLLGILLLLFPIGIVDFLGLPPTNTNFYPSLLGAVILGIGCALFLELVGYKKLVRGLALGGAILINMVGSFALICWLTFGSLTITMRGQIILWGVAVVVFTIGIIEIASKFWGYEE